MRTTHADVTAESDIQLVNLINQQKFSAASAIIKDENYSDELVYLIESESQDLDHNQAYSFCTFMLDNQKNGSLWHKLSYKSADNLSKTKPNYKYKALNHLLKAIEKDNSDWKLKEEALSFYEGGMLPKEFGKAYAEIVIKKDPTNEKALMVLENEWDLI